MSNYNQNQSQGTYPPPGTACPYPQQLQGAYVAAPPPAGYPTRDGNGDSSVPTKTQTRGDGFWKGCFAALCCCCVLDACF